MKILFALVCVISTFVCVSPPQRRLLGIPKTIERIYGTRVGDRQGHTPAGCLQWRIQTTPPPYLRVWIRHCSVRLTPCKGIQDSLGFWISRRGFRIPVTGFQYLSVELGSWIPIVSGIPDSLSSIPHSKI